MAQGDLTGVSITAEQIGINRILLTKFNATLTVNLEERIREIWIQASAKSLKFSHDVLLNQKIEVERPDIHLEIATSPNRYRVKNSWIRINKTNFNIDGTYDPEWIRGRVSMDRVNCQDLLDSIPMAMKSTINGMKLDGSMTWEIYGEVDIPSKSHTSIGLKLINNCKVIEVPDHLSVDKFRKKFKLVKTS